MRCVCNWSVGQVVAGIEVSVTLLNVLLVHVVVVVESCLILSLLKLVEALILGGGADELLGLSRIVNVILVKLSHHTRLLGALRLVNRRLFVLTGRSV